LKRLRRERANNDATKHEHFEAVIAIVIAIAIAIVAIVPTTCWYN